MVLNKMKNTKQSGFTIVELLIVIVVIGILAAITIVAYSGITNRANTASAQTAAENVTKKSEIYNAEPTTSGYPKTLAALTGAAATTTYYLNNVSIASPLMSAKPGVPATVSFYACGTSGAVTAPASYAAITVTTGNQIYYWDYSANTPVLDTAGITSGLVGTYNVACYISAT